MLDNYPDDLINKKASSVRIGIVHLLTWLDVKINKYLLFGKVETISARMGRSIQSEHPNPIAIVICDFLNTVQADHCKKAYQAELDRLSGKGSDFNG